MRALALCGDVEIKGKKALLADRILCIVTAGGWVC